MKMKRYIAIPVSLVLALAGGNAFAQSKDDNTYNESVVMRSSFSPVVSEAHKLGSQPTILSSDFELPSFRYDKTSFRYPTTMTFETIKPAKVKGEPAAKLYNTHLKAAIGTYFSSLLDASYSETRSKDLVYGAQFRHRSSLGTIKDYAHSTYANNDLRLYGKKIWDAFSLDASLFYSHQRNYYYGFSDTVDIARKDYRTSYHTVGGRLAYRSLYRDEKMLHNAASAEVKHTSGKWGYKETDVTLAAGANKTFSLFSNQEQRFGLELCYNQILGSYSAKDLAPFYNPALELQSYDNRQGSVDIKAYMDFQISRFRIHAALDFVPAFGNSRKFYFLPTAIVQFPRIADCIELSAGLKSHTYTPTLQSIAKENPYVSPLVQTKMESSMSLFAKAAYLNSNGFRAGLEVGLETLKDKYFYSLDTNAVLNNMFVLTYDNAKRFYAELLLAYNKNNISLNLDAVVQGVNTDSLSAAWYTPVFEAKFSVGYTAADKLTLSLVPTFSSSTKCLNEKGEEVKLKAKFDLNLAACYNYSDQLSFFVELNNLAFQRYYNYYNYPSQRLVALLGARFAF